MFQTFHNRSFHKDLSPSNYLTMLFQSMNTLKTIVQGRIFGLWLMVNWTEEPGGQQSKGLQRVRHDWTTTHICENENDTVLLQHVSCTFYIQGMGTVLSALHVLSLLLITKLKEADIIPIYKSETQINWVICPRAPLVALTVKNSPAMQRPGFNPWVRKIHWRSAWQPTPILLPGAFHGQRSLVGYSP